MAPLNQLRMVCIILCSKWAQMLLLPAKFCLTNLPERNITCKGWFLCRNSFRSCSADSSVLRPVNQCYFMGLGFWRWNSKYWAGSDTYLHQGGTFTVKLTASNSGSSDVLISTDLITVLPNALDKIDYSKYSITTSNRISSILTEFNAM